MITHRIFPNGKPITPVVPVVPKVSGPHKYDNWPWTPNSGIKKRFLKKEDFDTWFNEQPFGVGSLVTMHPTNRGVTDLNQVHLVIEVNSVFDKVEWQQHTGEPKIIKLTQLHSSVPGKSTDWVRWDDTKGYRELTSHEFHTIIKPNHDFVSNYHKTYIGSKK
jgi:hypothetical protein